jgi:hypothetical protein
MGTSAKRLGLETEDLELELRLRRIEVELEKKVNSNIDAEETGRSRSAPPQITGLRVAGQTPGTVTMNWNASQISDLRRYQIQFAEDGGFSVNLQTFTTRDIMFTFSTASEDGGASGTAFFTRVRVQNSIGAFSVYSVVINTATGEVIAGDLADDSVGADAIDETSVAIALTLPAPPFEAADSNKFLKVNSAANSYELRAGTLPDLAASSDIGKIIRVAAANDLDYTSYTFPSAATAANFPRGSGTNFVNQPGTLPPLAVIGDVDKVVRVSAADTLVYFDQTPTDAAATTTSHSNRKGTLTLPGGFKLHWDTVDTTSGVNFTVATFAAVRSVMVCWGESAGTAAAVKAYVSTANTTITIRQDSGANMEITYFAIEEV